MQRQSLYILATHALLALAVVVAATVLGAMHVLTSDAITAIYGSAIGLIGASASALSTFGTALNGKVAVPASKIADAPVAAVVEPPAVPPAPPPAP